MIRRVLVFVAGVLVFSLGTVMTAGIVVPESNAGLVVLTVEPPCVVPAGVRLSPSNLNRRSPAQHTLTARLSLPAGAVASGVTLSLAGGEAAIEPNPGGGPAVFTFRREDVLSLVGPVNGDYVFEVSGRVWNCTFAAVDTVKINGPV